MKKFTKFCLIMIMALCVVGALLVGIGVNTLGWDKIASMAEEGSDGILHLKDGFYFDGESFAQIGKKLKINAKFNIEDSSMFDKSEDIWEGNRKKTKITDDSVDELKLEAGGCHFRIMLSDDDAYYIEYEGEGKSQAYMDGNDLYIKVLNASDFDFSNEENCFTLYVPTGASFSNVDVDLGAGEMHLDGLQADEMKIDLGAGQIVAGDLSADNIKISVGAGDVELQGAVLGTVKIEVGAGNCSIEGKVFEDIKAECAMGNITLELEGDEEDFDYELECVSGNLKVGDTEYSGLSSSKEVDNNANKKMDLQCVMGNIEVDFE